MPRRTGRQSTELGCPWIDVGRRAVRRLEVVADHLGGIHAALRDARLDERRNLLMQLGAPSLGQGRIGLVADEGMPEDPGLAPERIRDVRFDEVAP